ncbi:hypothetical protein [Thermofilum sp.]|uniref:hypothetical protein n=1 Tax=Thermofilum sp. TaxID=1961369 RepID=UPI00319EBAAA
MGVDVFGEKPRSKKGEYFQSNWWGWRPIWAFTVLLCRDLLDRKFRMSYADDDGVEHVIEYNGCSVGDSNDGLLIPADVAEKMGKRIMKVVRVPKDPPKAVAREFGGDDCDKLIEEVRNLFPDGYSLSREHLIEWAEFLLDCGGFRVC